MPKVITIAHMVAYLRALAETGNATLAAAQAGVSRDWAYKKRKQDARFDGWCREMGSQAKARLRVQQRRARAGGWTGELEERFLAALGATCDVPLAASSVGLTAPTAYRHRTHRPRFAFRWAKALRRGREMQELPWFESAQCFFERQPVPADNPVKVTSIDEVLRMMARCERADRRRGSAARTPPPRLA
jgi:hypothetical protein